MSANNIVLIGGRLCRPPELTYSATGNAMTKMRIAVDHKFKGDDGQLKEDTSFVPVRVFGPQAEACANHLNQGDEAWVEGRLRTFETGEGDAKRYHFEVKAHDVRFGRKARVNQE